MLTIPDLALAQVNGHPQQAAPDTTDIAALVSGVAGVNGIVSGFDASYHGTMTVSIAAGTAKVNGATVNFAGADVTIGSNTAGYERTDIICLKSDGTLDLIQGLAGNPPVPPGLPATECYLYRVDIANGAAQIMSSDVTDKRAPAAAGAGGGGGAPTGTAGGALSGTYPNPSIATAAVVSAMIADGTIVDADIAGTAAIAQSKINGLASALSGKQDRSEKGTASGYASLDTGGNVPLSQLGNAPGASGATGPAGGDLSGTYPSPAIASGAVTPAKTTGIDANLVPTAVKTANYTAAASDFVPVDTTSATVTITLPTAPPDRTRIGVKFIKQGGANTVTILRGGSSDVFDLAGGATTLSLVTVGESVTLQYAATPGIWYVQTHALATGGTGLPNFQHVRTQLVTPFFSSATSPHVMLSGSFTPLTSKGRLHIDLAGYFWGLASFAAFGLLWGTAAFPLFQPASTSGGTTPKSGVTHEVLGNIGGGGNALESFGTVSKTIPFSGLSAGTTYNWSIIVGVPSGSMAIPTNGLGDAAGTTNLISLAATPDRRKLYIGNAQGWVTILNTDARVGANAIGILNPHNQYGGKIPMFANIWPNACQAMSVTPDGTRLLVAHGAGQGKVAVINTSTDAIIGTYTMPGTSPNAQGVACPNNTTAYVTDWQNGVIYPFNIAAGTFGTAITLGTHPGKCRRTPDGSKIYVIQKAGNTVWCINTATNTVIATITVPGSAPSLSDLAVMPDGSAVWVTDASADQKVIEILVGTQSVGVTSAAMLGGPPQSIGIDPQGLSAWVGGSSSTTDPINQLLVSDPPGAAAGTYKGQWFINWAGATVAGGSNELAILIDAFGFISRLDWQRAVYDEWPIGQFSCDPTSGFVNSHCHTIYEDVL